MTANPCFNCNHLRKDHHTFMGDWYCEGCRRAGLVGDDEECLCYVPTRVTYPRVQRCWCGGQDGEHNAEAHAQEARW